MPGPVFLEGERVALHPPTEEDVPFLLEEWNSSEIRATRSDLYPMGPDDVERYLGGTLGREDRTVALLACRDGEPVGLVLLVREMPNDVEFRRGELAYWIARDEWGNGYATEASTLLLDHAFGRLGVHRVRATAYETNPGSRRVLEKLGFAEEGRAREAAYADSKWVDQVMYGLIEDEWNSETA